MASGMGESTGTVFGKERANEAVLGDFFKA